jgi:hypothetical protein
VDSRRQTLAASAGRKLVTPAAREATLELEAQMQIHRTMEALRELPEEHSAD